MIDTLEGSSASRRRPMCPVPCDLETKSGNTRAHSRRGWLSRLCCVVCRLRWNLCGRCRDISGVWRIVSMNARTTGAPAAVPAAATATGVENRASASFSCVRNSPPPTADGSWLDGRSRVEATAAGVRSRRSGVASRRRRSCEIGSPDFAIRNLSLRKFCTAGEDGREHSSSTPDRRRYSPTPPIGPGGSDSGVSSPPLGGAAASVSVSVNSQSQSSSSPNPVS